MIDDSLNEIIPESANKPYDVKEVIHAIADYNEFLETQRNYAANIITGFARFNGISCGIVANQPNYLAGVLDINASRKAASFVRFCDEFETFARGDINYAWPTAEIAVMGPRGTIEVLHRSNKKISRYG